ncbi:MAG: acylphosphatase [Vampirovibrionales bacterium]|nr:acylphosphatase [Vampirovibrionales bacterium]
MALAPNARHFFISGRVQGVGFRYCLRDEAQRLALAGWCRNLPDGRVEAFAQGDDEALDALQRWCHRGPPGARVTQIAVEAALADTVLSGAPFEIRFS